IAIILDATSAAVVLEDGGPASHIPSQLQYLASQSTSLVVGTAVATSLLTVLTAATTAVVAAAATSSSSVLSMPPPDLFSMGLLFDYLQFLASTGHMEMPGAPPFYHDFTDSLAWTTFNLPPPSRSAIPHRGIHLEDGDIVAGVLAYAERLHIAPDTLFLTTATGLACVVVGVVVLVSVAYGLVSACAAQKFDLVKRQLAAELPTSHLFLRCVVQSALGVALLSEYALSMTSSFQLRYGGGSSATTSSATGSLYGATASLCLVCGGLLVLGVCLLRGKSEAQTNDPTFKFTFGAYYKYYTFENRYFFVAKMGAEIASGVIVGRVEDVPTQLTLLLTLQFAMFLYTTHCSPYVLEFQSIAAATAFVLKMLTDDVHVCAQVTYVLLSSFVTTSVSQDVQEVAGTVSLVLQIALLLLFNSRQLHILYKQIKCLVIRRRRRKLAVKTKDAEAAMLAAELERHSSLGLSQWSLDEGYRPAA
ncbi:hypothetical protein DYB34_004621, partial [Aphanomyces astaci]